MMQADWLVILPVSIGAAVMLRWTYAYFVVAKVLEKITYRIAKGPFEPHYIGVRNVFKFCAHSHWIMGLRDMAMLAAMYLAGRGVYEVAVALFIGSLVPLVLGGEFSVAVAKRLNEEADSINKFLQVAQQLTAKVDNG